MRRNPAEGEAVAGREGRRPGLVDALRSYVRTNEFLALALIAILLVGASMRLTGVNWDEQTHLHPDERFLTDVETKLAWPKSIAEYFDEARSPLNPHNQGVGMFVYGTLPIFIVKAVGTLLDQGSYWQIHLVGRVVSALYDLGVVALVFFLGRRLYGRWVGLLASFLMACTVLAIQHSHFFTVETFTTLLVTLAFYFTIRALQDGGWANWALTGATFGMAVAGKISVATYVLIIGVAALMRAARVQAGAGAAGGRPLWQWRFAGLSISMGVNGEGERAARRSALVRMLARATGFLAVAGLAALIAFRVTQPYAFTGPSPFSLGISMRWLQQDVLAASSLVNGSIDFPPSHQWTDREPIWFAWRNMVLWGMGLPLGLAAWAGWLVATVELVRKRKLEHLLIILWVTLTFVYQSVQFVKTIRYFLPIYPLLVILAGYFLVWLWQRALSTDYRSGLNGLGSAAARGHSPGAEQPGLGNGLGGSIGWGTNAGGEPGPVGSAPRRRPGGRSAWRELAPLGAALIGAVVLGGTFLYAEAFTNIYRRPLTRVEASRWVYANIPAGSRITWEMWDDTVPQNVDGKDAASIYHLVETDPYWEDTPEKLDAMLKWLDEADYIVLSSNRVYGSVVRLPERFPLTIAYYKYLFSGELGFDTIKVFTSYPNLGPIRFVDDTADESFTVYDHPKVIILKKTPRYSSARARALLGDIELERVMRLTPLASMASHHGLMLTPVEQEVQRLGGTWRAMFNPEAIANRVPVLAWLVVLELLAAIGFPLAFVAFRRFRDRGFIFAKGLGVLGVAYLAWLGASLHLVPYTRGAIAGFALLLLAFSALIAWRQRPEMEAFLRQAWRRLLLEEGLFLAFLGAFLLVRWGNPDLWHPVMGGEKPMDFAYLNAVIKSTWFPPYDPWFAGGYINYYYFGQVIVATLIKLSAVVPEVAYNLALPTLFAMTAMGGYAVVDGLLGGEERRLFDRPARFALFGALLIAVLGNLGQVRLLWQGLGQASGVSFRSTIPGLEGLVKALAGLYGVVVEGQPLNFRPEWWYWNASRIMGAGEINEFPFFSFLYADLHAHLIALPFGLLALGLIVSLVRGRASEKPAGAPEGAGAWPRRAEGSLRGRLRRWAAQVDWGEWLALGLLALVLGELRANNTWDYPTYLLLALGGLVLARMLRGEGVAWQEAGAVVWRGALLIGLSMLFFVPYLSRYGAAYTSVELWQGPRTSLGDYLLIHGVFLLILVTYALSRAFGYQARGALARTVRLSLGRPLRLGRYAHLANALVQPQASFEIGWLGIVATLGISALSFLVGWWVLGVTLPLILVGLALVLRRDLPLGERFAAMLFALGLALTLAVEVVVLKGDVGRMNTVFKFYLQVWVLWGVAAAVALEALSRRWARWPRPARRVWQAGLGLLLCGAALYPLAATWGKINDRFDPAAGPTLDGTAYAQTAVYYDQGQPLALKADMDAIHWLERNIDGSPVILEGNAPLYRWGSRVSVYTGLPTVIGWDWHERQQRAVVPADVVGWRLADVSTLYNSTDRAAVAHLLKLYDISYVYVGQLEQVYYDRQGLAKFAAWSDMFRPVYQKGPVTIYQVRKESLGGLSARPFDEGAGPSEPRAQGAGAPTAKVSGGAGSGGPLMLDVPVDQLPLVDDRGWNALASAGPLASALVWWLALAVVGWAAWPLVMGLLRGLPDRGYLVARGVGWLAVGYGVWLGASAGVLANRVAHVYAVLALLVAAGAWLGWRRRGELAALWRSRRWLIVREELLFSGAFAGLVLVRLLNPDLWQPWFGGEKMMEVAYLNAILKSAHFPPYDPYYAGGYINYYYYGLYLVDVLVKLTGVVPEVAFNLAVPTFFALTVGAAFSFGHALSARLRGRRSLWGGLAAAVGVAVIGNLTVLAQWLAGLVTAGGATPRPEMGLEALGPLLVGVGRWLRGTASLPAFDYWYQATRVIPFTINEFPFFSYLFADLHPHMMAIPFTITALVLVVGRLFAPEGLPTARPARTGAAAWLVALALVVGALGPMNSWDLPTYLGLVMVLLVWAGCERGRARAGLVQAVVLAALALALYLPFYGHYVPPHAMPRVLVNYTGVRYLFVVYGLWLVGLYGWLGARWWLGKEGAGRLWRVVLGPGRVRRLLAVLGGRPAARARLRRWLLGAAAAATLAALLAREAAVGLLVPLAALGVDLWLRPDARRAERLAGLVGAWGCLIVVGTELFYLADFLQGSEWQRMNTVFKFGLQAWVLMALAAGVGVTALVAAKPRGQPLPAKRRGWRAAWTAALAGLAAISLAYVPLGTAARVNERFPGGPPPVGTLDGLAYMRTGAYHWPDQAHTIALSYDSDAIHWLLDHVHGTPVIAEAPLGYYREGGLRVSSYTGLPTLVGAHQNEQRPPDLVAQRQSLAERLFQSASVQETLDLMQQLRVQYVYFGQLETIEFGAASRAKFDAMVRAGQLQVAYENPQVVIYRRAIG